MRLPQQQLESPCFSFQSASEVVEALGQDCSAEEASEIRRLFEIGLPPITSGNALSVMLGYNPGFVWSLLNKTKRHYRFFEIPKGTKTRMIEAPKVALKGLQKWLSFHFQNKWMPQESVHGFVRGRSHISAAAQHLSANWVLSLDVENFFPSTSSVEVAAALHRLGYVTESSIQLLTRICCLANRLVQGAPTSPILSNIALDEIDSELSEIAKSYNIVFTRYADDLVFSGKGDFPDGLVGDVEAIFAESVWKLSERKKHVSVSPHRLKVHGLLVHGEEIRLTKGYRNRIRAYQHLVKGEKVQNGDRSRIVGHLNYAEQVRRFNAGS